MPYVDWEGFDFWNNVMKAKRGLVFTVAADFTVSAFHFNQSGFTLITPTLLRSVVLMFVIRAGKFAFCRTKLCLTTRKFCFTN
jgi:hypothetical protein